MEGKVGSFAYRNVFVAAVLAAIVALALALPTSAYADSLKSASVDDAASGAVSTQALKTAAVSKTVKKQGFTMTTKVIKKKATAVKAGTTKLTFKGGQGYLKFTAKKTKKHSFTFSNLKSKPYKTAFVEIQMPDKNSPEYSFMENVATKGGKSNTLWLARKDYTGATGKVVSRPLAKRTGSLKLKKGQDVYFYFFAGSTKASATLKVA